jgi:hypothetical protein
MVRTDAAELLRDLRPAVRIRPFGRDRVRVKLDALGTGEGATAR